MRKKDLVTKEGLEELKKELDYRLNTKKSELSDVIEDAKEKGDVSENEGLYLAQDEFEANERRISELQKLIDNAHVVDSCAKDTVCIGSRVTVKLGDKKVAYTLVGEDQANPLENMISYKSPIGLALKDKKSGDKVKVTTPGGEAVYEILSIE